MGDVKRIPLIAQYSKKHSRFRLCFYVDHLDSRLIEKSVQDLHALIAVVTDCQGLTQHGNFVLGAALFLLTDLAFECSAGGKRKRSNQRYK